MSTEILCKEESYKIVGACFEVITPKRKSNASLPNEDAMKTKNKTHDREIRQILESGEDFWFCLVRVFCVLRG